MADRPLNFRQRCSAPHQSSGGLWLQPQSACFHHPPHPGQTSLVVISTEHLYPFTRTNQQTRTDSPDKTSDTLYLFPRTLTVQDSHPRTHTRGLTPAARQTENRKPTTKSPPRPHRGRGAGGEGARDLQHPKALLTGPPHAKPRRREVQQLKTNNWQLKTGN